MSSMDKDGEHRIISKTEPVSTIYFFLKHFLTLLTYFVKMASLPLQMVLIFDKMILSWAFFLVTLLFAFYKVFYYNLPQKTIEVEVCLLIVLQIFNQIRLYIGIKTNKVESITFIPTVFFIISTLVCIMGYAFFLLF